MRPGTQQPRWTTLAILLIAVLAFMRARAAEPPVVGEIHLKSRQSHAEPSRSGFTHTGAGNIDVAQPTRDTLVITMTGACIAGPHPCQDSSASMPFDLEQAFDVSFTDPKLKQAKLVIEARIGGLLRSHSAYACARATGSAEMSAAQAAVCASNHEIAVVRFATHSVTGDDLAINDHVGPVEATIVAGTYTLKQTFAIAAAHPRRVLPASSATAEFAPEAATDPMWLGLRDPFHAAIKKNFGFKVTIKLVSDK